MTIFLKKIIIAEIIDNLLQNYINNNLSETLIQIKYKKFRNFIKIGFVWLTNALLFSHLKDKNRDLAKVKTKTTRKSYNI